MRTSVLSLVAILLSAVPAFGRQWTDNAGTKKVEAAFAYVDGGLIYLRLPKGEMRSCQPESLSVADREYVRELTAEGDAVAAEAEKLRAQPASATGLLSSPPILTRLTAYSQAEEVNQTQTAQGPDAQAAQAASVFKRIYHGCNLTIHLIRDVGTAAWQHHHHDHCHDHCCHHHHHHHLDQLKFFPWPGSPFWWYTVVGEPNTWWAISIHPNHCGEYRIWRIAPGYPIMFWAHAHTPL